MSNLSENEKRTLARWYLGGVGAILCAEFSATTRTIRALARKGYVDASGLTPLGKSTGKALADGGMI